MIPGLLYKYRSLASPDYVRDIFLSRRLFLPTVPLLNDKAEGAIEIIRRADASECAGALSTILQSVARADYLKTTRVLSLSEDPACPTMWAHYAQESSGICIGFATAELPLLAELRRVKYRNTVAIKGTSKKHLYQALSYKHSSWKDEKEWRLIKTNGEQFIQLADAAFNTVIFGSATSPDQEKQVREWVGSALLDVQFQRTHQRGFDLEVLPLESE